MLLAPRSVEDGSDESLDARCSVDISDSDTLADKVGAGGEVLLKGLKTFQCTITEVGLNLFDDNITKGLTLGEDSKRTGLV